MAFQSIIRFAVVVSTIVVLGTPLIVVGTFSWQVYEGVENGVPAIGKQAG